MAASNRCPTLKNWMEYLQGEFAEAEEANLTTHLDGCVSCRELLETLSNSDSILDVAKLVGEQSASEEDKRAQDVTLAEPGSANSFEYLLPPDDSNHLGRLDHYDILEVVGKGGFGTVFRAFDTKLHRVVAIKVMAPELAVGATARKRFIREAQAAAAVRDDHVIAIFAVEDHHQPPYLVMEFVAGVSLQQKLDAEGPPELKEILRIGAQTARGLASAHNQGLVHRDIKPGNILLENGVERVKISDFGLARAVDDASITQSGVIAGTPMYMSPEQANGEAIDHRSDLFSLGSVLYAMCTGRSPFRASGTMAVLKRVMDDTPRPIPEINEEIPPWMCDIVAKLHGKKPDERFPTAEEVADLLEQHLAHLQHPGKTPMPAPVTYVKMRSQEASTPKKTSRRWRWRWAAVAMVLVLLAFLPLLSGSVREKIVDTWHQMHGRGKVTLVLRNPRTKVMLRAGTGSMWMKEGIAVLYLQPGQYEFEWQDENGKFGCHTFSYPVGKVDLEYRLPAEAVVVEVRGPLTETEDAKASQGFVQLFNGKDFDGWAGFGRIKWRVVNGEIRLQGNDKTPWAEDPSRLHSSTSFTHCHLRAEIKFSGNPGASGVVRFRDVGGDGPYAFVRIGNYGEPGELGRSDERTGSLGIYSEQNETWPVVVSKNLVPPGKWFTLEIIARGQHVTVKVNGAQTAEATLKEIPIIGCLTLQAYLPETVIHFRKIEIKELPPPPVDDQWTQLFNGKDLTGWHPIWPGAGKWDVKDGILTGKAARMGRLVSDRDDFIDFHFRAQVKINKSGNAGVFFRAAGQPIRGYEAQINVNSKEDEFRTGSLRRCTADPKKRKWLTSIGQSPISADEWFTLEVIARGKHLQVLINGKKTSDIRDDSFAKGFFALEFFGESSVVQFKKIEIKEFPPTSPEVPTRAADVLPFLAGSWKLESIVIEPDMPEKQERLVGYQKYDFVANGKFLRGYGTVGDDFFEIVHLYAHDRKSDRLRLWLASTAVGATGPATGAFDAEKRRLQWMEKLPNGNLSFHVYDFVDANTIKSRLYRVDPNNKIVHDMKLNFTRLEKPILIRQIPLGDRPKAMNVLYPLVGEWRSEMTVTKAATPGKEFRETARASGRHILGGRMVEITETNDTNKTNDYILAWYDAAVKHYRIWHFQSAGFVFETTGMWNKAAKTITWKSPDDNLNAVWTFKSDDVREFHHSVKGRDGKPWLTAKGVSRRITAAPPGARAPFTILSKCTRIEHKFAALKDAVAAAKPNDIIEIHGNGAFVTDSIKITRPLTIRAAKGYEPVLQMSEDAAEKEKSMLHAMAPLTLEGLHLHIRSAPPFVAGKNSRYVVRCEGAALSVANCRFVLSREDGPAYGMSAISVHHCPSLEVVNCQNLAGGFAGIGDMPDNSEITISNCISTGSRPLTINHNLPGVKNISVNLRNNFFHERLTFNLYQKPAGDDATKLEKKVFRIQATENILRGAFDFSQSGAWWQKNGWLTPAEATTVFRGLIDWHEKNNVYVIPPDSGFLALSQDYKFVSASLKTPAEWQTFWKLPKLDAIRVNSNKGICKDDAWMKKMKSAPEQLTPDDFRLSATSPAKGGGKGDRDFGINAELIGPGLAYERWKRSTNRQ